MKQYILLAMIFASFAAFAEEIPYTSFGHLDMVENVTVSPQGNYVAAILNGEAGPTVVVAEFGSRDVNAIVRLKHGEDRVDWILWANEDRLLLSVSEAAKRVPFKYRVSRLYQVGRDGSGMHQIRRKPTRKVREWVSRLSTNDVLSTLPDDPEHILMQLWDERDDGPAVFKVNIEGNDFEKLFPNTYDVHDWFVNGIGDVVLGLSSHRNTRTLWHRPEGEKKWQILHTWVAFEDDTFSPVSIEGDKAIVLSDRETGYESAWQFDVPSGQFEELVFAVEDHDITGAIRSNDQMTVIGFSYVDNYRVDFYTDEAAALTNKQAKSSLSDYETTIVSHSNDKQRLMVRAQRDDAPPKYIWMNLQNSAGGVWFSAFPYLEGMQLAKKTPIEFEAHDGLRIEGYLTMPPNPKRDKPSLIVFPHGGPHARDSQYFDQYVQLMANRGHAVLQVNFRGSSGFGTKFETAGYKQWGRAMQDDIYDAVDWLATQDLVDIDRKCIVGGSYGGYVALVAAFQKPNDYKCVVAMAGVSDLYARMKEQGIVTDWKVRNAKAIGDVSNAEDREMMKSVSAINHIRKIRAPMLLIHGTEDTRVDVDQSRSFYNKAKNERRDIEYLEIESGTHFFDEHHNRLAVFKALDEFLAKHL